VWNLRRIFNSWDDLKCSATSNATVRLISHILPSDMSVKIVIPHVNCYFIWCYERFATSNATVMFLTRVLSNMNFWMIWCIKWIVTFRATERFLSCLKHHMDLKFIYCTKGFSACYATVWFSPVCLSYKLLNDLLCNKRIVTFHANKGLLSCVKPHVGH